MADVSFPKSALRKHGLPECGYGGVELISTEFTDKSRWSIHYEIVFKWTDGKYYSAEYSEGATELQDESPWEYDDEIECTEVAPVTVTVTKYKPIEEAVN